MLGYTPPGGFPVYWSALALVAVLVVIAVVATLWRLVHWPVWPVVVSLLLLPAGALLAEDRFRSLGHALTGQVLVVRHLGRTSRFDSQHATDVSPG